MGKKQNKFFKDTTLNLMADDYGFEHRTAVTTFADGDHDGLQRDIMLFRGSCCVCPFLVSITIEKVDGSEEYLQVSGYIKNDMCEGSPLRFYESVIKSERIFSLCHAIESIVEDAEKAFHLKRSSKLSKKFDDELEGAE